MKLVLSVDADEEGHSPSPIPIPQWSRLEPVLERELPDGAGTAELSLSLVTPDRIRELNREYREVDEPTDVLSFPLCEGEEDVFGPVLPLGDVVICPAETARLHPGLPEDEALCLMLAHGFLHLLGWDHDTEERQAAMWSRQEELKSRLMGALRDPGVV